MMGRIEVLGGDFFENRKASRSLRRRRPCPARNSSIILRQGANEWLL